jgi:DNA-directed RNA polymerase subunit RPC12/RpoP
MAKKSDVNRKKNESRNSTTSKSSEPKKMKTTHIIKCTNCDREFEIDLSVKEVLCPDCTMIKMLKLYGIPEGAKPKEEERLKKPPGWHFYKEFVDKDGNVYHKGVEQPKLFGTKSPTEINFTKKKKKKINSREKEEAQREIFEKISIKEKQFNKLIKSGKEYGKIELQKEINKLKKEVRKYL